MNKQCGACNVVSNAVFFLLLSSYHVSLCKPGKNFYPWNMILPPEMVHSTFVSGISSGSISCIGGDRFSHSHLFFWIPALLFPRLLTADSRMNAFPGIHSLYGNIRAKCDFGTTFKKGLIGISQFAALTPVFFSHLFVRGRMHGLDRGDDTKLSESFYILRMQKLCMLDAVTQSSKPDAHPCRR